MGRVEAVDYVGNEKDVRVVSDLVDDLRDAVMDYQVSGDSKQLLHLQLRWLVQTAQQQVICDMNLELIVSEQI